MEPESSRILGIVLYKIVSLGVGALSLAFGYKLFMAGVVATAGNLEASGKGMKLKLKNGAPGTFFALFGAIIISYTIGKGLAMSGQNSASPIAQAERATNHNSDNAILSNQTDDGTESELYDETSDGSSVATNSSQDEPKYAVMTDLVYGSAQPATDSSSEDSIETYRND